MDIKNIALVRATNIIPFDGIVRPISEVPYLHKERGTEFYFAINDLLKNKGMLKEIDWTKLDEIDKIEKINNEILKQYMPYNSDYNSMVLWSLNGLVPDDMNNTFSDKTCAIIEGLQEQIEQSEMISLVPTDTAIKGNIKLSNKATILISKERYEELSQKEKEQLTKLEINIEVFEGDLKEAVNKELVKEGRYTAEDLSLKREYNGYIKSDTSDELINTIDKIAEERKIAQVLHWNVITGQNDELDKLANVKDEFKNSLAVTEFYKKSFLKYLFTKMDIDNRIKVDALYSPETPRYMQSLCEEIDRIGIDKYKELIDEYNNTLQELRENGKLPTPQEIINSVRENQEIDLIKMIEEHREENDILSSAIMETEQSTRIGVINQQVDNFKQLTRKKEENTKEMESK